MFRMFSNKINKIAFAITMLIIIIFTWLRPEKHEVTFGAHEPKEYTGAYGTICDKETCQIAIYDGIPEKGEIQFYYLADIVKDNVTEQDIEEYFYLVDYSAEEMSSFGYDVSEGSTEEKIHDYTGKYAMGYFYY